MKDCQKNAMNTIKKTKKGNIKKKTWIYDIRSLSDRQLNEVIEAIERS